MAELKTKVNDASVEEFLNGVADEVKRKDSFVLLEMMRKAAQVEPKMWGGSIVGFGSYHYVGKSSEGDWPPLGFSPRKQTLTLYAMGGWEKYTDLRAQLGKHSLGKGCLYIKRLSDVKLPVLEQLIAAALADAIDTAQAGSSGQASPSA